MISLEHIAYENVSHPSKCLYSQWRKNLRPFYKVVWRDIFLGWVSLISIAVASIALCNTSFDFINILFSSMLFGFALAYLSLFLHEAAHFNLTASKKYNDLLANIFLCLLFGVDIKMYRKIHWIHHRRLGTPFDTENSYFNTPNLKFIVETLTGIHLLRIIIKRNNANCSTKRSKLKGMKMLFMSSLVNLIFILILFTWNRWPTAIAWITGMLIIFPFFATIRQILEHRDEFAVKNRDYNKWYHGKVSRLFDSSFFSRVFGGAGFNKHMLHHWDPTISYTRLKDLEVFLRECDETKDIIGKTQTSYFKVFKRLIFN